MKSISNARLRLAGGGAALAFALALGAAGAQAGAPLNPCAARTINPCADTNPCGAARVDPSRFQQPAGAKLAGGRPADLVREGERLWQDRGLGKTGLACSTCHFQKYAQMNETFARPYPHFVKMPHEQAGVTAVSAAEMVNFCMIVPMGADPLPWESRELAALAAYVESIRPGYQPVAAGAANPCNPCGAKNPCNPCGAKNPCNPCGAKR